jgi:hypothetical protein
MIVRVNTDPFTLHNSRLAPLRSMVAPFMYSEASETRCVR